MPVSTNRSVFDAAIASWNEGDLASYLQMYDPAIRLHGYGPEPMTKDQVTAMYGSLFEAIGGIHLHVDDVIEADDRLCARARMTGTHDGPLFGVEPTGNPIDQNVITILRFDDDRCVERWSTADTLAVLHQIGATALP